MNHIEHSLRQLRLRPGLSFAMIAMLALGLGATTAIFSLFHEILVRSRSAASSKGCCSVFPRRRPRRWARPPRCSGRSCFAVPPSTSGTRGARAWREPADRRLVGKRCRIAGAGRAVGARAARAQLRAQRASSPIPRATTRQAGGVLVRRTAVGSLALRESQRAQARVLPVAIPLLFRLHVPSSATVSAAVEAGTCSLCGCVARTVPARWSQTLPGQAPSRQLVGSL